MPIDYKRYPPNWKTEIVPKVLERALNCCEVCGIPNKCFVFRIRLKLQDYDGRYKFKAIWFSHKQDALRAVDFNERKVDEVVIILTIAHLDHDETNHDVKLDRLKAMCQMCHLKYDAKEKYRRANEKWENDGN